MAPYIYERPDWPNFRWNDRTLACALAETRHRQGRLIGRMESLARELQDDANLRVLTEDAIKSAAIEGERLDPQEVRSSFARRLGLEIEGSIVSGRDVDGLVAVLVDVMENCDEPLTEARLFRWHEWLFPTGGGLRRPITVGAWRTDEHGAMEVTSGRLDRPTIHFRAPPAAGISGEMIRFLDWFENRAKPVDPLIEAAVAHIWFVTLHPFDDGNGRIARAVADLAIARSERAGRRFYSVSAVLRAERPDYYAGLEATQKGDLDLTIRLSWFLEVIGEAIDRADLTLSLVLRKARFWGMAAGQSFNERQRRMLNLVLDDALLGPLTTGRWSKMNKKCSPDTALRDIDDLVSRGFLAKGPARGRSTHYILTDERN